MSCPSFRALALPVALAVDAGVDSVLSVESVETWAAVGRVVAAAAPEPVVFGFHGVPRVADCIVAAAADEKIVATARHGTPARERKPAAGADEA